MSTSDDSKSWMKTPVDIIKRFHKILVKEEIKKLENETHNVLILGEADCNFAKKFIDVNPNARVLISDYISYNESSHEYPDFQKNLDEIMNNKKLARDRHISVGIPKSFLEGDLHEIVGHVTEGFQSFPLDQVKYIYASRVNAMKLDDSIPLFQSFCGGQKVSFQQIIFNCPYLCKRDYNNNDIPQKVLTIVEPFLNTVSKAPFNTAIIQISGVCTYLEYNYEQLYIPQTMPQGFCRFEYNWSELRNNIEHKHCQSFGNSSPPCSNKKISCYKSKESFEEIDFQWVNSHYISIQEDYSKFLQKKISLNDYLDKYKDFWGFIKHFVTDCIDHPGGSYEAEKIRYYCYIRSYVPFLDIGTLKNYLRSDNPKSIEAYKVGQRVYGVLTTNPFLYEIIYGFYLSHENEYQELISILKAYDYFRNYNESYLMDNIDFFLIVVSGFFNENDLITNNDPLNPKCLYPLHFSAEIGHLSVVKCLVNQNADINAKDKDQCTPLHRAALNGHLNVVEYLVNQKAEINSKDKDQCTPLHRAALNGHLNVVEYLVNQKADINAKTQKDSIPLHLAALNGHLNVVEYLVNQKADINAKDKDGWTPLHRAAYNSHLNVVEYLVNQKADINAKDKDGWTPLHFAAYNSHLNVVEYLVNQKADINAKKNGGSTPLHWAASKGHISVVECLVNQKADINAKNDDGSTPLHWAALNGHLSVVKCLVNQKADINARDSSNKTALDQAIGNGRSNIVNFLRSKGGLQ